jgi:CubicO group peptidase (beta-lactamase class C family)
MRAYSGVALLLALTITTYLHGQSTKSNKIEAYMKQANKIGVFNGNILVMENDRIIYKASLGYADANKKVPLTDQSIFRIGSIAKEFNAVGIMMLKEQGKLTLDQKVSEFFPDLPTWAKKVSIKNLLQYTSGLPDVNWLTIKSEADNWKDLYALPQLKFEPGSDYFYNNNNTFLQRKIIEKVTGMKFNDFVQQQILKPCAITNAIIDPTGEEPFVTQSFDDNFKLDSPVLFVTGWTCLNMNDFYKWSQAIINFKNINPVSTLEILTPVAPNKQAGLGKGTMKNNQIETHIHDGTSYSSQALLVTDVPKGRTLLFLTNQKHENLYEINDALNNILDDKSHNAPRKSILTTYKKLLDTMDATAFLPFYKILKEKYPEDYGFDNFNTLNEIGYYYLYERNLPADAITIFEKNVDLFPKSGDIVDSLGEGYLKEGDKKKALFYYKKSIDLGYTGNPDAKKIIAELEK